MEAYYVQTKLGEGGFAKVYLAKSEDYDMITTSLSDVQDKMVALKVRYHRHIHAHGQICTHTQAYAQIFPIL